MKPDINKIKSIHFVGIKGVAMTALAIIAKEKGITVGGSDVDDVFPTDNTLGKHKIVVKKGFESTNVDNNVDLVIYTGAHGGKNNPEVVTAAQKNIKVVSHAEALGWFMAGKHGISVAGTHGKTTTAALIAHLMDKAGYHPTFAIGCGDIMSLNTPARYGSGIYFITEADEYVTDPTNDPTPRFLWQRPDILVITNIDYDHPDVYPDREAYINAYVKLVQSLPASSTLIVNNDDLKVRELIRKADQEVVTFGATTGSDFLLRGVHMRDRRLDIVVSNKERILGSFALSIPGFHNALNATAAVAVAFRAGVDVEAVRQGITGFIGTKRRFEPVADINNILLYDDYAHHPNEIKATLAAARAWLPGRRIVTIFQPHTFSRTKRFVSEFAASFSDADVVILTDIYASARESDANDAVGEKLYEETQSLIQEVYFAREKSSVLQCLKRVIKPHDVVITMGAGDIYTWLPKIKTQL